MTHDEQQELIRALNKSPDPLAQKAGDLIEIMAKRENELQDDCDRLLDECHRLTLRNIRLICELDGIPLVEAAEAATVESDTTTG